MGKQVQSKIKILRKVSKKLTSFLLQKQVTGSGNRVRVYYDLFDVMKDCSSSMAQINLVENIVEPLSSDDGDESLIGNENVI